MGLVHHGTLGQQVILCTFCTWRPGRRQAPPLHQASTPMTKFSLNFKFCQIEFANIFCLINSITTKFCINQGRTIFIVIASVWCFKYTDTNRPISQIPQCTCPISHNTPFRTEMCTFLFWMVHCNNFLLTIQIKWKICTHFFNIVTSWFPFCTLSQLVYFYGTKWKGNVIISIKLSSSAV